MTAISLRWRSRGGDSCRRLGPAPAGAGACTGGPSLDSATLPVSRRRYRTAAWCAGTRRSGTLQRMRRRLPWILGAVAARRRRRRRAHAGVRSPRAPSGEPQGAHDRRRRREPARRRAAGRSPRCTRRPTQLLPGGASGLRGAARGAARATRSSSTSGPRGAARAASSSRSSSARRCSYGKRVAFLGVDLRDNRDAATPSSCADIPVTYPSYEDPDGQVANELSASSGTPSTIFYDAERQADLPPPGPVPRRAPSSTPTSQRYADVVTEVRARARRGAEVDAALALRHEVFCRRAGRGARGGARRPRRRGAAPRRACDDGARRRHLPAARSTADAREARADGRRAVARAGAGSPALLLDRGRRASARAAGARADRARARSSPPAASTSAPGYAAPRRRLRRRRHRARR